MAETAIKFLLENLQELIKHNATLIGNVRGEVDGLMEDLRLLNALIKDSDKMSTKKETVKERLSTIRSLTYAAEDAVDAFVVEVAGYKAKNRLYKAFHCIFHALKLRDIAKDVQDRRTDLKGKDERWLFGRHPQEQEGTGTASQNGNNMGVPDVERDVVDFDDAKTILFGQLAGTSGDLKVISVVGMGGLGKTTLVSKVYHDPSLESEFPFRFWIHVSQTYDRKKLFLSILEGVYEVTNRMSDFKAEEDRYSRMDAGLLAGKVAKSLTEKYLIVVDDVWEKKHWDSIKIAFPDKKNGSRILLTSRNEPVAVHADPQSPPCKLNFLTTAHSWDLLQKRVFRRGKCPSNLSGVGKQIAEKCGGLPLAVETIARQLKPEGPWEAVARSFSTHMLNEQDCMEVLARSYHLLPRELKQCFLYCGVFPADFHIPVWILILLWIAESLVQKVEDVSMEEMAEKHLEDLVARNLVLVQERSFTGRIKTCRIHGMLRFLCLREALAENFLLEIKGATHSTTVSPIDDRRLCIHSDVLEYIETKKPRPHVRSFLCFAEDKVDLTSANVRYTPDEFKLLRVCHVKPISFPRFPSQIEQSVHLTYLAFSGDFKTIPAAVSNLWNLQTLIAHTTSRTIDIKADISKMLKLRHLHTNKPSHLHEPVTKKTNNHNNASSNGSLITLTTITPESYTDGVLSRTLGLKKLGIHGKIATLLEDRGSLVGDLSRLHQLVTLKLLNAVCTDPRSDSKLPRLPHCHKFPPNLKRLTLAKTSLGWDEMHVLGMLPKLEELKLKDNAFKGVTWSLVNGDFLKLKALQIWKTDLAFLEAEADNSFPILENFFLKSGQSLRVTPSSLKIKLQHASSSAQKIRQQNQESIV